MAVKKRVFQVAREFNVSNETLIDFLKGQGFDVRNHMSPVGEDVYNSVAEKFGKGPAPADTDTEFRKKLKDLQVKEKESIEKKRKELDEKLRVATE